jgi:hypothetical protein
MPEQSLVITEVQDELRFLFEAPSLQAIRGAGALLESLARFTLPALARRREFGGAGIVTGGRQYVATFPTAEAGQRFTLEARRTYRQRTAALTLGTSQEEVSADDLITNFGTQLRRVRGGLYSPQAGSETAAAAYRPELRWCDSCHRYPAVHQIAGDVICRPCANRRTHIDDQDARLAIPGYQSGLADAGEEDLAARPVWERLLRWLRDTGIRRSSDAAHDIGDLAGRRLPGDEVVADAAGYRAAVIAEINDFDRVLDLSADSQQTLRTTTRVNRLLDEAFFEAVTSSAWRDRDRPLNFEVLVAGGDRIVFLLPADVALTVTARALRTFEAQSSLATEGRRLSFCAGVGCISPAMHWGMAAYSAQTALAAARQAYLTAATTGQRGSWRSVVGLGPLDAGSGLTLNIGELERATAHARALRRVGLSPLHLGPMVAALQAGTPGPLAWLTAGWTDAQRRALTAVLRDLAPADAESSENTQVWPSIIALLPWTTPVVPPPPQRSRPDIDAAVPARERSA